MLHLKTAVCSFTLFMLIVILLVFIVIRCWSSNEQTLS